MTPKVCVRLVSTARANFSTTWYAVARCGTEPKYVSWKSRRPTYIGPSSSLRTLSTYLRYSDELAKLPVLLSHGVCWGEEAISRGGGFALDPMTPGSRNTTLPSERAPLPLVRHLDRPHSPILPREDEYCTLLLREARRYRSRWIPKHSNAQRPAHAAQRCGFEAQRGFLNAVNCLGHLYGCSALRQAAKSQDLLVG